MRRIYTAVLCLSALLIGCTAQFGYRYLDTFIEWQLDDYVELTDEKKLKPTSIGEVVTDFLANHFTKIVNLGFTAEIERNFDRIAKGDEDWVEMMTDGWLKFYLHTEWILHYFGKVFQQFQTEIG